MRILSSRMPIIYVCLILVTFSVTGASNELHNDVHDSGFFAQDAACGPRCLTALSHLTKVCEKNGDVETIYRLLGIPVNSPTNLKHLKDAAQKMGFKVQPRKLSIRQLSTLDAYAILPIGQTSGTKEDPLHFVLFAGTEDDQARLVNTRSLIVRTIPLQELSNKWKGFALFIPSDSTGKLRFRPMDGSKGNSEQMINLGEADVGTKLEKRIVVWTKRDRSEWKIVKKSCSCLDVKLIRNKLGQIVIDTQLDVKRAGLQTAEIVIVSEDKNIRKDYRLYVYGKNSYRITPKIGFFEVETGRAQYPVILDYYIGTVDDEVSFSGFKTDIDFLECEVVNKEIIDEESLRRIRFNITLTYSVQDQSKEKIEDGSVFFMLNTPSGKREIPLKMTVHAGTSSIRLSPAKLFIIASKSSFEQKGNGVKLTSCTNNPINEIDFQMTKPLPLQITPQKITDNEHLLHITLIPDKVKEMPVGMHKGEIIITLNGKRTVDKTKFPVSVFIRD